MKLSETQLEILSQAIQKKELARAEYEKSSANLDVIISLITGKREGGWKFENGELKIEGEDETPVIEG